MTIREQITTAAIRHFRGGRRISGIQISQWLEPWVADNMHTLAEPGKQARVKHQIDCLNMERITRDVNRGI